jgi:hypothetical protein
VDGDPNAWLDVTFQMMGGDLVGSGGSFGKEISDKISSTVAGVLSAGVTLSTSGAIVAGNASYSSAGYGGTGTVMSPYGFACIQNGVPRLGMSVSGDVFLAGELRGAYGTFGALRIASGGFIASGAYDGSWAWPASGGGWLIHQNGILFGDKSQNKYFQVTWDGNVYGPNWKVENGQMTLDSPIIINPRLPTFNVSVINSQNTYDYTLYRLSTDAWAGLYIASVDTGNDGASFSWSVSGPWPCWLVQDTNSTRMQLHINMKGGTAVAGDQADFYVQCTVNKGGTTSSSATLVTVYAS